MDEEKDYKKETSSRSAKHTKEDLKAMQALSLEQKIKITQTRIIEWYQQNEGKVYVSFSGGKDSTVLLDLVRRIYPDVPAVQLPKTGGGTAKFIDEEEIITYYTGSTNSSSSLGENGDIYLKVV